MTLIPILVAGVIVLVIVLVIVAAALLIGVRGGRYAESLLRKGARVRPFRRRMIRSYIRELEQSNPLAARAYTKMERVTGETSFRHTRKSLAVLTAEERRAYLDLFEGRQDQAANRSARRHRTRSGRHERR